MSFPVRWRAVLGVAVALLGRAAAAPMEVPGAGYGLDLPEGWRMVEGPEGRSQSFADPTGTAVLQVFSFPAGAFASSAEMATEIGGKLGARGEGASYRFSGLDATLSEMSFPAGAAPARGYGVFLKGERADIAVLAFAAEAVFETERDALLSALDSFCPDGADALAPGPIGQFASPFPAVRGETRTLPVGGRGVTLRASADEQAAGQDLVEREARILAAEKRQPTEAWQRFFRVIYRDNFRRLQSFGRELDSALGNGAPRVRAEALLSWIQGFRYERTGTLSDLASPLVSLAEASGDCDSRALLYVMLLHHLGIDAVLLVSPKYQHSAAGVAVPGPGARIEAGGRSYVFAEVTAPAALGLVAKDQADPKLWIPVTLGAASPRP